MHHVSDNFIFLYYILIIKHYIYICLLICTYISISRDLLICAAFLLQVLVDMVRVPDWAIEAAGQEMRGMGQDAAMYHPGLYLTPAQVI